VHNGKKDQLNCFKEYDLFNDEKNPDYVNQIIEADIKLTLSNQYLHLGDRMAMAHGVICRCPLLDDDLAKHAFSISVRDREDKWIMREAMKKILPESTLHKKKSGFVAPLKAWWPILGQKYGGLLKQEFKNPKSNPDIKRSFQELILREWMRQYEVEE
jgi:asparagine synthetase B (glutamine-hydrolysing)